MLKKYIDCQIHEIEFAHFKRKSDVFKHRHVGEKRIILILKREPFAFDLARQEHRIN